MYKVMQRRGEVAAGGEGGAFEEVSVTHAPCS